MISLHHSHPTNGVGPLNFNETVGVIKKVHRKCKRKCIESIKESNKEISPVRLDVLSGIGYNTYTIFERSI